MALSVQKAPFYGAEIDAFGRFRTASPATLWDSKALNDDGPLLWDDQEVSGGSTTSTFSKARASVVLGVAATTAGKRVRQTFRSFNYQPGKSQLVILTGIIGAQGAGLTAELGMFDDNNGLFFRNDEGTMNVVVRSKVSGSVVDTATPQTQWNLDAMNGSGRSGYTLDWDKAQIFLIDYEWLGVGRVRFGVVVDGIPYYVHESLHANASTSVYMSTPNLPIRYSIENDGTGAASTVEQICNTVISEGGEHPSGVDTWVSNGATHVDADVADTVYALVGVRLKSTHIGATIEPRSVSVLAETNDDFEWFLALNPTVAGSFTYSDITNSALQSAAGATANTVTGGYLVAGGYGSAQSQFSAPIDTTLRLGAAIDGTVDEMVLCVRPLTANANILGGVLFREVT